MTRIGRCALLLGLLAAIGCSHPLRITNLHEYRVAPVRPESPPPTVALASADREDPAAAGYVEAVAEGLRHDPGFGAVLGPGDGAAPADVAVDLEVAPAYRGEPGNFLVAFPGFFVFAPAIWGYGYEAAIETRVSIRRADGAAIQLSIPTRYRFRHAALDRTWIELGWLAVPPGALVPLVSGFVFVKYDEDLTQEFVAKVSPNYGTYVARRIREAIERLPPAPPGAGGEGAPAPPGR